MKSILIFVVFLFCSCAGVVKNSGMQEEFGVFDFTESSIVKKEELANGCFYVKYEDEKLPLIFHVVCVPMENFSKITCSPAKIYEDGLVKGERTCDFARRTNSFIAINASPFKFPQTSNPLKNLTRWKIAGIYKENGKLHSESVFKYSAVLFSSENQAEILVNQEKNLEFSVKNDELCVGGFFSIIKDGLKYGNYIDRKCARLAFGLSRDGRNALVLCVEEGWRKSRGMNYSECADVLLKFDAWNALCFDGGDSTGLCIDGKNVMECRNNRKVALNLGFVK